MGKSRINNEEETVKQEQMDTARKSRAHQIPAWTKVKIEMGQNYLFTLKQSKYLTKTLNY